MKYLKGPKQFIIPTYQRIYSWTLKEGGQLFFSLLLAAFDRALFLSPDDIYIVEIKRESERTDSSVMIPR
ncbi:MAG TPA: hypothetical protein DCP92_20650 [Nitrospiraceae bacterium]|jgi:uncharacterized protein with ParB-like and HNH nuclease domain|nr:hypothetical protein [Nitrospiraceae bacterium]